MATVPSNVVVAFGVVGFTSLIWKLAMNGETREAGQVGSSYVTAI